MPARFRDGAAPATSSRPLLLLVNLGTPSAPTAAAVRRYLGQFLHDRRVVELTRWLLLPQGKQYRDFQLIRYETGKPETPEKVNIVTRYLAEDYTILAFKILSLKAGYTYELTWYYR